MIADTNKQNIKSDDPVDDDVHGVHKSFRYITTKWLCRDDKRNSNDKFECLNKSKEDLSRKVQEPFKRIAAQIPSTIQLSTDLDLESIGELNKSTSQLSNSFNIESSPERRRRRALNTVKSYFEKNKSQENFKVEHSDGSTVSIDTTEMESILKEGIDSFTKDNNKFLSKNNVESLDEKPPSTLAIMFDNEKIEEQDDYQKNSDSEISSDVITISKPKTSLTSTVLKFNNIILNNHVKLVSLFVGDLNPSVTENDLYLYFTNYPGLISVKIPIDTTKNVSLEYGYVNFDTQENANLATEGLNYTVLKGSEIRIMPSVRDKVQRENLGANLFFSNLSPNLSSRIMYDRFKAFGKVFSCKYSSEKCTCFISFYEKLSAYKICKQFNQTEMDGRTIGVSVHISRKDRESFQNKGLSCTIADNVGTYSQKLKNTILTSLQSEETKSKEKLASTQYSIFMRNMPINLDNGVIRSLIEPYGTVKSILTRKVPQKNGSWSLVTMTNEKAVERTIQNLNALEIEGKKLFVTRAIPREEKDYAKKEAAGISRKKLKLLVTEIDLEKDKALLEEWCTNCESIKSAEFFSNSLKGEIPVNKRLNGYGYIELNDQIDVEDLIKKISDLGISCYKIKIDVESKEKTEAARYPYVMNQPVFTPSHHFKYNPNTVSFSYVDPAKMFQIASFQNIISNDKLNHYQKLENYNKIKLKERKNFDEQKQELLTEKHNEAYHIMWEICVRLIAPKPVLWNGSYYDGFSPSNDILSKSRVSSLTDHLIKFFWNNNFDDFYKYLKENQIDKTGEILYSADPILARQILEGAMYLGIIPK